MHKGLLCYHSTFFNRTFNGNFREAFTGIAELPQDDVKVFERFNVWLYTGRLYDSVEGSKVTPPSTELLIKIYLFGDCRGIEALKNAAMDLLGWNDGPPPSALKLIYDGTPEGCKLRRYAVDALAWACTSWLRKGELTDKEIANLLIRKPRDFVADFVRRLLLDDDGNPRLQEPSSHGLCRYHDHMSSPKCRE